MKKIILLLLINCTVIKSQSLQWVNGVGSTSGELANRVTTDPSGNVFHAGAFSGSVDFDSGAGTFSLSSGGTSQNGYVSKVTAAGAFVWAQAFTGANFCTVKDVVADAAGNVYLTGAFSGTVDFNPGAGTFTLGTSSVTNNNVFICKLNSAGAFVWAKQVGNTYDDYGNCIALDGSGNVFVGGYCSSAAASSSLSIDLDPGVGTAGFTFYGRSGFVIKLDNAGNYLLAQAYGTSSNDEVCALEIDGSNNVYIGGYFQSSVLGISPPVANFNFDNPFLAKLTNSLVVTWAKSYVAISGGVDARVTSIEVDASGNVFNSGNFELNFDFDPGVGTYTLNTMPSSTDQDVFVAKLNSAGNFLWADKIASGSGIAYCNDMALDASNNVLVTGYFPGTADFNPTAAIYYGVSAGSNDIFVCELDQNGVFNSDLQVYGSFSDERANSIHALASGDYYVAGLFSVVVDFDATVASNTIAVAGLYDIFVAKYKQCTIPSMPVASSATAITVCANTSTVLTANPVSGVTFNWYNAPNFSGSLGTGNSFTTPVISGSISYWAQASNTCSINYSRTQFSISTIVSPTVSIAASSSIVCLGSSATLTASGAVSYSWSTGATTTVIAVSPTVATIYTATGTAANSCKDPQTVTIYINPKPSLTLTSSSNTICTSATGGNTISLTGSPSGGVYSGISVTGSIFNAPATAGTYTTVYTYTNSTTTCTNSTIKTITVNVCTGLEELSLNGKINIYPNPNSGVFTLIVPEQGVYSIINSIGQTVESIEVKEVSQTINVNGLADGIYYIIGKTSRAKIIVSK